MNIRRIIQAAASSFWGQGVTVISQLMIPPFFLRYYPHGFTAYGEWIALTALVNHLGTLNYGIQTYANNEISIRYNRGDITGAKELQSNAVRLLLLLITSFAVFGLVVFAIPIGPLLKFKYISSFDLSLSLYLIILQMAAVMIFSFFTNSFMIVGKIHKGNYWQSAQRLFYIFSISAFIYLKAPFPVLAAIQLGSIILFSFLIFFDLRATAAILLPSLKYGTWKGVLGILKPSGHFMLIALSGFLTWQAPVLLIQAFLGSASVATFSLVRVVFQMSRQLLSVASNMISQDITMVFGQQNWSQLKRLYDLSERIVLFLIPIVSIGSLLMCPFLFTVWLHKRSLYHPELCILMAIISAVLGIKEHKTQFQSSSNRHEQMSIIIIIGYSLMLLASAFALRQFGIMGFLVTWLAWESIQTFIVIKLNKTIFPPSVPISMKPVGRLAIFIIAAFGIVSPLAFQEAHWVLPTVVLCAVFTTTFLGIIAYFVFGVKELKEVISVRLRRRSTVKKDASA